MRSAWKIRVELRNVRPPIWRRLLVSDQTSLARLHQLIQDAFGWLDYHLHEFEAGGVRYGDPANDEFGDSGVVDERDMRLRKLGLRPGGRLDYVYDFGDDWEHVILLEEILPIEAGARLPVCLGGARACPPEDVGGIGGYAQFLEAIADPGHPEHERCLTWVGGAFDPERFDLQEANRRLRRGTAPRRAEAWDFSPAAGGWPTGSALDAGFRLGPALAAREAAARELGLRRDVQSLLVYLRDQKVSGTQSRGNLPLKAVAEIAAGFVRPPELEMHIGSYVLRARSEEHVRPVYFAHLLASGAGLISGGSGRRWRLTDEGEAFLTAPASVQVATLFAAWWDRVNWLVLLPYPVFDEEFAADLRQHVLPLIREMASERFVELRHFIQRLMATAGWEWQEPVPEHMDERIGNAVEVMVIRPLESFGILSTRGEALPGLFGEHRTVDAFSLTESGRELLRTLR